jgi:Concanavalin A-like lectin/glucanases superfamily
MGIKFGGLIGNSTAPVSGAAPGIWDFRDAYNAMRLSSWPIYTPFNFSATVLLVAGGGGGGGGYAPGNNPGGGGGGAGGLLYSTNILITPQTTYQVVVGLGGSGGAAGTSSTGTNGTNGTNSSFVSLTAIGGGGGSAYNTSGSAGGSGGGGAGNPIAGGSGTTGQGYAGGGGGGSSGGGGGGGGGASAVGTTTTTNNGGAGGNGLAYSITGSSVTYAGGGGGGAGPSSFSGAAGGTGGGGTGGSTTAGGVGTPNTGGGGGGAGVGQAGGAGGSGVVIISSPYVAAVPSLSGSLTIIGLPSYTNYSGSFNGSNQYLTVGTNSNWTFLNNGSSNFTVECWFNVPSTSSQYTIVSTDATTSSIGTSILLNNNVAGDVAVQIYKGTPGSSALIINDTVGNRFSTNTWNHLATVFNSSTSTCTVYMNGVSILSGTGSGFSSSAPTYTLAIGRYQYSAPGGYLNGYINNLRITNTAVYTSAFTPPTVPLSAITGTQLLTLQNATITDTSTNAFTITNNGSVTTTSTVQPFPQAPITSYVYNFTSSGSLTYTTNTFLNYAASFNGTSQYLSIANNAGFQFGTGDFTIECWVYTNSSATQRIISVSSGSGLPYEFLLVNSTTSVYLDFFDGSTDISTGSNYVPQNQWVHLAATRQGTSLKLFINGVVSGSSTNSTSLNATGSLAIGRYSSSAVQYYSGYISNVRVIKGTALYTSNFTPPTTHLTAVSGTQLLTCQNAAFVDNSLNNFAVTNNNTVTTTYTTVPFNY